MRPTGLALWLLAGLASPAAGVQAAGSGPSAAGPAPAAAAQEAPGPGARTPGDAGGAADRSVHGTPDVPLRTPAEVAGWRALTSPAEVVGFYRTLARRSPDVRVTRIGSSRQGRELLLVTLARPAVSDPREAYLSGRPVVLVVAQAHGDEPAGKEALMLLARDLAEGPLRPLLDEAIFLLVPQLNPDGAAAGGWGTRANRAGFNLNRDYLRLENEETRAVVEGVLVPWNPHVVVDAHELPGPPRIDDFYTLAPHLPNGPRAPARFTAEEVIPAVVEAVERAGHTHFLYHLPIDPLGDPAAALDPGSYGPRALTGYAGARGAVSVLFETLRPRDPARAIERRARIQREAMEALARFVVRRAEDVVGAVEEGRAELVGWRAQAGRGDSIAIRHERLPGSTLRYRALSATDGGGGWPPGGEIVEVDVPVLDSTVVTLARPLPAGYAVESHRGDIVRHLERHGLHAVRLPEPVELRGERLRVDSVLVARAAWEGYVPQQVWTTPHPTRLLLPAGSWVVPAEQPAAVLLFHLLEPESDDSFASLGAFAAEAARGTDLPVYRLLELPPEARVSFPPSHPMCYVSMVPCATAEPADAGVPAEASFPTENRGTSPGRMRW